MEAVTEITERRVKHDEIKAVSFVCDNDKCRAEIVIDLSNEVQVDRFRVVPKSESRSFVCPFCDEQVGLPLRLAINGYRDFLYYLSLVKQPAVFRIPS